MKPAFPILVLLFLPALLFAPPQSEHFRLTKLQIGSSGGASTSTAFHTFGSCGQIAVGEQSGPIFHLWPGFLSPQGEVEPFGPIRSLVLRPLPPHMRLDWERIPRATTYTVYGDSILAFRPSSLNRMQVRSDTNYVDANGVNRHGSRFYYLVIPNR